MNKTIDGYEISSYKEGFIDAHYEIGASIYNHWPMGGQTKKEQLEKAYSAEDFDHETRLYGFKDGKMLGFITCALIEKKEDEPQKAYFEWPYVLHPHRKLETILIKEAMKVLKEKGVELLVTRAGNYWGRSRDFAEDYGFVYTSDIVRSTRVGFDQLDVYENPVDVLDYDYQRDKDSLFQFLVAQGISEENARTRVENSQNFVIGKEMLNPWDIPYHFVSNLLVKEEEEIVATALVIHNGNFGQRSVVVMSLWEQEGKNYEKQMLARIRDDATKSGYEEMVINTGLWGMPDAIREKWEERGFDSYRQLAYYEKKL